MSDQAWPIRWDLLLRYQLIEIIALWEGRLTTNHLSNSFGLGRQQASKDINTYLREIAPENLIYDKFLKGYVPTKDFTPKLTSGTADEYLHLLNRNNDLSNTFEGLNLQHANAEVLSLPIRSIRPEIIRLIVMAARQGKRLEVDYVSVTNPNREGRIITPHTLVCTGLRWHVRAYCEKNQDYRDFVLSRFRGIPALLNDSEHRVDGDEVWNSMVSLKLIPNPHLSQEQQKVVAEDYGMKRNALVIKTRAALLQYTLQRLEIDPAKDQKRVPTSTQLVIENYGKVEPWLFG